jgi:cysteinyl-tRNA synthetase
MDVLKDVDTVLGCLDISIVDSELSKEIQNLITQREDARDSKDWSKADYIRQQLLNMGVEVMDNPNGVRWRWIKKD